MATNNSIDSSIPISIVKGGTNATSMATDYGVAYFDGSKLRTVASVGTSGQALTSTGSSSAPTFQAFSGGTGVSRSAVHVNLSGDQGPIAPSAAAAAIVWDNIVFDVGSNFNVSTGRFTASADGFYLINTSAFVTTASDTGSLLNILARFTSGSGGSTTSTAGTKMRPGATSAYTTYQGTKPHSWIMDRDAGDEIAFTYQNNTGGGSADATIIANATGTYANILKIGS